MRAFLLRCALFCWCLSQSACGLDPIPSSSSELLFDSSSNECKVLTDLNNDLKIPNKGYGTITITHPEIVSHFNFTRVLAKFTQVKSIDDEQELVRRLIRSFITTKVPNINQVQPLRPFVIRELLCPLLDSNTPKPNFCGNLFFKDQTAAIAEALAFLDRKEPLGNFASIDTLLQPLAFIKRPPRFDLHPSEQTVEVRIVFGLRDLSGSERKPATVIMEFAGTSQKAFYENLVKLFIQFKDKNDASSRSQWAFGIEFALDRFLASNAGITDRWAVNQIRVSELSFRGNDILWDFREYNFPSANASVSEFSQVPVANTPWIDFEPKDKDPGIMNNDFNEFLDEKGVRQDDLNAEQSIDFFEAFMASSRVKVNNSPKLQNFVQTLNREKNDSGVAGSKAFPYHLNANWMAPAALARPGMRFFEGDTAWSKNLKETCQGCHVETSSIASDERIESMQGFYHVSPRKIASDAFAGTPFAGSNLISNFLIRETRLRFKSLIKLVGCDLSLAPIGELNDSQDDLVTSESPMDGHSSGTVKDLNPGERGFASTDEFSCVHNSKSQKITSCMSRRTRNSFVCNKGHTELLRCNEGSELLWLIACEEGDERQFDHVILLRACDMPLPEH